MTRRRQAKQVKGVLTRMVMLAVAMALPLFCFNQFSLFWSTVDDGLDSVSEEDGVSVTVSFPTKLKSLWLRNGHGGFSNQLQCLNLAANLAVQYNRALWIGYGYDGSIHEDSHFALFDIFDRDGILSDSVDSSPMLAIRFQHEQPDLVWTCAKTFSVNPDVVNDGTAAFDPFPNAACIALSCFYAHQATTTPSQWFPHADKLWFPYAKPYHQMASRVLDDIARRALSSRSTRNGTHQSQPAIRLLGLMIRLGDVKSSPISPDCVFHNAGNRGRLVVDRNESIAVFCETSSVDGRIVRWSWKELLKHLAKQPSLRGEHFDAIYVGTNEPDWIKHHWEMLLESEMAKVDGTEYIPLFTSLDFPYVMEYFNDSLIKALLVEQLIVAKYASTYIPSVPSTITEAVLRIRLHENGFRKEDVELRHMYNRALEMRRN